VKGFKLVSKTPINRFKAPIGIVLKLMRAPTFSATSSLISKRFRIYAVAISYSALLNLLSRYVASQQYTKTSFYIGGISQVTFVVTRCGKAWYDDKLRCNTHRQNDLIRFVDKVIVKNLLRSAGTAWT
jgi:hypothetical protein